MKVLLFSAAICTLVSAQGPYPNGYPGSGYGCRNTCGGDDADVRYEIRASLETYNLPGSRNADTGFDGDVSMLTRTFTGVAKESSPFCMDGYDGTDGPLGPCISVNPGQRIKIKVVNDMEQGMDILRQHKASLEGYWKLASTPGQPELDSITWLGEAPENPEDLIISSEQNLPGWDASFDDVNLHLHGMQVVPHLFYPQGTGDPAAPWITITPMNENPDTQCFCYVFDVPSDHPQGTFFYHVHRHGSVAMQMWQGMFGMLQVGNATSPGSPNYELAAQGVTRDEPLIMWEWAVNPKNNVEGVPNTLFEGNFIEEDDEDDPLTIFATNNVYQPNFTMAINETVHYRLLCGQTTTGSAVYILDEDDKVVPFWVFASDGISYAKAYEKKMIVIGVGQREGLLTQFRKPGTYRVMQGIINDFQGEGEGVGYGVQEENPDLPMAYIQVKSDEEGMQVEPIDIRKLVFTPGMGKRGDMIKPEEIDHQLAVNFQVFAQLNKAPIPQFVIDGKPFDYRNISHTVPAGAGHEWTLTSNMNYFHPFHIHVNPFQVKNTHTGYLPGNILRDAVIDTAMVPENMWRDTVFIPPFGQVVLWQRFGELGGDTWQGKTVYHCHFLDHEDQGMIAAMIIGDPEKQKRNIRSRDAY